MFVGFEKFVGVLTSISVAVSLVTYYLAANKTWQVKHEQVVASSISLASYGLYAVVAAINLANLVLTRSAWQTVVEYALTIVSTLFTITVGLGWWVPGQRQKGVSRLLLDSLKSEPRHLGALAQALTHPDGAGRIVDILKRMAVIDGRLDARERAVVQLFADTWGIAIDWAEVAARRPESTEAEFAAIRADIEAYLASAPPIDQALQLAELIVRLVNADGEVTREEGVIARELESLLHQYAGAGDGTTWEIHLVPQSREEEDAMRAAHPLLTCRSRGGGNIFVAAVCSSREYAELVRSQFSAAKYYAAVARVAPRSSAPDLPPRALEP